jgi:hypothetical protein
MDCGFKVIGNNREIMTMLSTHQAYLAMFAFLEKEYRLCPSDDIGGLLGSMSLLPGGMPADSAVVEQWREAVDAALAGTVDAGLTLTNL